MGGLPGTRQPTAYSFRLRRPATCDSARGMKAGKQAAHYGPCQILHDHQTSEGIR